MNTRSRRSVALVSLTLVVSCGGERRTVEGLDLDAWLGRLDDRSLPTRVGALERIARFGTEADPAVDEVVTRLRAATDARERRAAADALAAIDTPRAREALRGTLEDPEASPGAFAEAARVATGRLAPEELASLTARVDTERLATLILADDLYEAAVPAGPSRVEALLRLAAAWESLDPRTRSSLIHRLGPLGAAAGPAVPVLRRALDDPRLAESALGTLAAVATPQAATAVVEWFRAASDATRAARLDALAPWLDSGIPEVRAALHAWLAEDGLGATQRAVVTLLAHHGTRADVHALAAELTGPLGSVASDAMRQVVGRDPSAAEEVFTAWRDTAIAIEDEARARAIVRAFAGGAHPELAAERLAEIAPARPELGGTVLGTLDQLFASAPDVAAVAAARVVADPRLPDGEARATRLARQLASDTVSDDAIQRALAVAIAHRPVAPWAHRLLDALDGLPEDERRSVLIELRQPATPPRVRAAALERLAREWPDDAFVVVRVGSEEWRARIVLGHDALSVAPTEHARLHVPPGSPVGSTWKVENDARVIWLDAAGTPSSRADARFALTPPPGAESLDRSKILIDPDLLDALTR